MHDYIIYIYHKGDMMRYDLIMISPPKRINEIPGIPDQVNDQSQRGALLPAALKQFLARFAWRTTEITGKTMDVP